MYKHDSKTAQQHNFREGMDVKGNPYRVLVVDDEEIVRKLLTQILKSMSYYSRFRSRSRSFSRRTGRSWLEDRSIKQ